MLILEREPQILRRWILILLIPHLFKTAASSKSKLPSFHVPMNTSIYSNQRNDDISYTFQYHSTYVSKLIFFYHFDSILVDFLDAFNTTRAWQEEYKLLITKIVLIRNHIFLIKSNIILMIDVLIIHTQMYRYYTKAMK